MFLWYRTQYRKSRSLNPIPMLIIVSNGWSTSVDLSSTGKYWCIFKRCCYELYKITHILKLCYYHSIDIKYVFI